MDKKILIIGVDREEPTIIEKTKKPTITAPPLEGYSGLIGVEKSGQEKRRLRRKNNGKK